MPGDDVFVSTFTFAATANAVIYCGANPVFIDSETATWNMSPQLLAEALADARAGATACRAAVVVVDLYGQCADYDAIVPMCQSSASPIIEDAAEALGATYKGRPAGTLGDIGIFSFNGNKIITTSGGGMLVTPDDRRRRPRPLPLDAGPRAGRALRAHGGRVTTTASAICWRRSAALSSRGCRR